MRPILDHVCDRADVAASGDTRFEKMGNAIGAVCKLPGKSLRLSWFVGVGIRGVGGSWDRIVERAGRLSRRDVGARGLR